MSMIQHRVIRVITYGLEMERTRLRQELEVERNLRKKLEVGERSKATARVA